MHISFHGAARTVTGSKHLITLENGYQILLDCGMFQGLGNSTRSLNDSFGFDASKVNLLLLSHAHIDHSGLIPKLVAEGFTGRIICTRPTVELSEILLMDSAQIQAQQWKDNNQAPGYSVEDVKEALKLFETIRFDEWLICTPDLSVLFTETVIWWAARPSI